jgi:hypothetical protein
MREIPVGKHIARIDDKNYDLISAYTWRPYIGGKPGRHKTVYAIAHEHGRKFREPDVSVIMHRLILNAPKGIQVDHRDGDGLNNQEYNLRLADNISNAQNGRSQIGRSSQYKGVSLDKRHGTWKCYIRVNKVNKWLGQFKSEIDAAMAYDRAARKFFGEFACLNFND